jgi:hypothetical protein
MANPFEYVSTNQLKIGGVELYFDDGNTDALFRNKNRDDAYYMAKSRGYLQTYEFINATFPGATGTGLNILELGIFSGGSTVFFDKLYNPKKLVCIDLMQQPAAALTKYIREEAGSRIRPHYGTNQGDRDNLRRIIESEFDGPIDIVIDDASHWYEESRASFETIFPFMRTGGLFLLEDWTWAHGAAAQQPGFFWADKTALTNLVFRFTMALAADQPIIDRMMMLTGLVLLERGEASLPTNWTLDGIERPRGKELSLI